MDPEFTRIILRVSLLGGGILVIGAGLLVVAFRAFSPARSGGRDFRPAILVASVLVFVMMICALLMRLSMVR